jgi:hypothetical protein
VLRQQWGVGRTRPTRHSWECEMRTSRVSGGKGVVSVPARLWEWIVDCGAGSAPTGVCGERDRAMEQLSRSLVAAGGPASGRVVPVALVDGAFGSFYRRFPALEMRADYEKGIIKWT